MRNKEELRKHIESFNKSHGVDFSIYWESNLITFYYLNNRSCVFKTFKEAKAYILGYLTAFEQLKL